MLIIRNTYDERDLTITTREVHTGRDLDSVTLEPGQGICTVDIESEHQVVISARPRAVEAAPVTPPTLTLSDGAEFVDEPAPVAAKEPAPIPVDAPAAETEAAF